MARRPNYGAEKRQKEIKRQQKQDAKAEKKRLKREEARAGGASEDIEDEELDGDLDETGATDE
jgi:hypothetical protein